MSIKTLPKDPVDHRYAGQPDIVLICSWLVFSLIGIFISLSWVTFAIAFLCAAILTYFYMRSVKSDNAEAELKNKELVAQYNAEISQLSRAEIAEAMLIDAIPER